MLEKIKQTLNPIHINKQSSLVLGISGGADSMSMLFCLRDLGYKIIIAHFDHKLRHNSNSDSLQVKKIAKELDVIFYSSTGDTEQFSNENKLSIEEAARILRYTFLFDIAEQEEAQAVAVAHNAQDQAETILMHILRGSGLSGLQGMQFESLSSWNKDIPLIRPILNIWPSEINKYCDENNLVVLVDPTNNDTKYKRNKIRHELFPVLEKYNPQIKENLVKLGNISTEDNKFINHHINLEWDKCAKILSNNWVSLSADKFNKQTLSMKRHLIRKTLSHIGSGLKNIDFSDIERAVSFIEESSKSKRIDLVSNIKMEFYVDDVLVYDHRYKINLNNNPQLFGESVRILGPEPTELNSDWSIESEIVSFSDEVFSEAKNNSYQHIAYFDSDLVGKTIVARTFQVGDRFVPLGMNGNKMKLSDFFINQKIIQKDRENWPLICNGGNKIIWIFGQRISHEFRLTKHTKNVLKLRGFKN